MGIYVFKKGNKRIIGTGEEFVQAKLDFETRRGWLKASRQGRAVYSMIREAVPSEIRMYEILKQRKRLGMPGESLLGNYHLIQ